MKKLPAFIMVIALLVMNFASMAHAECEHAGGCGDTQIVKSIDDTSNQDGDTQQANCDCCATCSGHHHHSHIAFMNSKADPIMASSQSLHSSNGDIYLSQLNYPPSKPPKA